MLSEGKAALAQMTYLTLLDLIPSFNKVLYNIKDRRSRHSHMNLSAVSLVILW